MKKKIYLCKINKITTNYIKSDWKMDMKDRIRQLMEIKNMTQQAFATFTGLSTASVCGILNGRTKPTLATVEAINNAFTNINIDWLMFGKGSMFLEDNAEDGDSSTPQGEDAGSESALDFGGDNVQPDLFSGSVQRGASMANRAAGGQMPQRGNINVVYNKEAASRKITEIRVFYDDQTWECFVPKEK